MLPLGFWQPLPSVSPSAALLLPSNASLRFIAGSQTGPATLTFDAWNQTQGLSGKTFDITNAGSATAFSSTSTTLSIAVTPSNNHAPALATLALTEPAVAVNAAGPGITVVSLLKQAGETDQDGAKLPQGIALIGANSADVDVQYMLAGGAWKPLPNVSSASALLLPSNASLRLLAANQIGAATLMFDGWDLTQGSAGQLFNIVNIGGASAFSAAPATVSIQVVNTAPALAKQTVTLPAVNENLISPAVTAASLLARAGYSDANGKSATSGIAITGDSGLGAWQWLNGSTWTALPSVSSTSAFLLSSVTQVRFQPADNLPTNTNGSAALTYLAWDETTGVADTTFALTSVGGASAFSTAAATASMAVNFVKPAPTWLSGASAGSTPVVGFPNSNAAGDTVAAVFGSAFRDSPSISVGVAITAQSGTADGGWQYSTDGGSSWQDFLTTVSTKAALLLHATDLIRFVPSKAFSGPVSLTAHAWDGSGAFASNIANLTKTGTGATSPSAHRR